MGVSVAEYLKLDRAAEVKSEFHDGELFPVEAVTLEHSLINVNTVHALARRLDKLSCRVTGSSLRVQVAPSKFLVPGLLVFCGNPALADSHRDTITNPQVVIEILSKSTAGYDNG